MLRNERGDDESQGGLAFLVTPDGVRPARHGVFNRKEVRTAKNDAQQ